MTAVTTAGAGAVAAAASLEVWHIDLDLPASAVGGLRGWLSADELLRAERLQAGLHRTRFIVGRAALRSLLGNRLGCSAAAIRLQYGTHGKPMLATGRRRLEFSLAHCEGDAVIALTGGAAVGVDLERLRPIADVESLASLVFSKAERRALRRAPDPVRAFLNGWTRKEAYVKALGLGLSAPLKSISVSLSDRARLLSSGVVDQSAADWRLLNVPHERALVAVALGPRVGRFGTA